MSVVRFRPWAPRNSDAYENRRWLQRRGLCLKRREFLGSSGGRRAGTSRNSRARSDAVRRFRISVRHYLDPACRNARRRNAPRSSSQVARTAPRDSSRRQRLRRALEARRAHFRVVPVPSSRKEQACRSSGRRLSSRASKSRGAGRCAHAPGSHHLGLPRRSQCLAHFVGRVFSCRLPVVLFTG